VLRAASQLGLLLVAFGPALELFCLLILFSSAVERSIWRAEVSPSRPRRQSLFHPVSSVLAPASYFSRASFQVLIFLCPFVQPKVRLGSYMRVAVFVGDDCCAFTGLISLPQFLQCTAVFLFRVRFLFPPSWSQDPVLGVRSALGNSGWHRSVWIFTARHTPSAPTTCFSLSRTEYRPYSAPFGLIHQRPQQPFLISVFPGIAGRAG
jgi:hypothetical protein